MPRSCYRPRRPPIPLKKLLRGTPKIRGTHNVSATSPGNRPAVGVHGEHYTASMAVATAWTATQHVTVAMTTTIAENVSGRPLGVRA